MPKAVSFRKGLSSILFWSVIAAAFIGPGTVTTASSAGASFQLDLLWALSFSVLATIVLQEAAARITLASGKNLGEIIALKYGQKNQALRLLLFSAVSFGCAAYQTGNILGAVVGLSFIVPGAPAWMLTLAVATIGISFLWNGNIQIIARLLGMIVALMGGAFCWVAAQANFTLAEIARSALWPTLPANASLLIIGLIGTTIVPYNLFLASGIGQGQQLSEMRIGIALAVLIGGIISAAILFTGTLITGPYSYEALTQTISNRLGEWASGLFGFGLFAAGMTSSVTAPLAAAITGRSLMHNPSSCTQDWKSNTRYFRWTWLAVFGVGLFFSLTGIRPIPAIIAAQAINGALLPIVAIFLLLALNDQHLLSPEFTNKIWSNILTIVIVDVTCFLGLTNIWKAASSTFSSFNPQPAYSFGVNLFLIIGITIWLNWAIFKKEKPRKL